MDLGEGSDKVDCVNFNFIGNRVDRLNIDDNVC